MRKKGLFKEANENHSAENIPKKSRSNKKTLPAHVIEENNVEGFNSHEENRLKYFRTIMEDENKIASDERNLNKKLVKRGFQQPEISRYIKDVSSDNYNTNKHRMIRIMFLANQLARDAGVELLIFGYFPNVTVGSCAAWAFGEETKNFVTKPTAKSFLEHWENLFSLKEDIRQNPDKANVDVENEEPQTENVELNKEKEVVGVHVSHIGSEGESVELTNKESEAGGVESSNKKSFEPEQKHFPSHLIHGTQHPSSTFTVITLTQSEDGTYLPPPHLIDQLDAWGLGVSPSPIINTLAPPSSGQLLLEIATESTSDRTGASNVAASVFPVPVNGTKRTVPVQGPATTPVEFDTTPTPFGTTSTQNPATAISMEQPLTDISLKARITSSESQVFPSGSSLGSTSGENAQTKGQASPKRLPAELTAKAASNPSLLPPVTSSEAQVLITAVISAANTSIGNPVLRFRETGQPVTKNKDLTAGKKVRQKEQESQNHLPVELTTMTASNPSSFPPVTMSETQVLISSPSPPVSVVTLLQPKLDITWIINFIRPYAIFV
ncbi:hypothetical protein DAPPUDRAFT_322019 [Daphnia pulex]|uniref:Uncharacterized protein n=1 Tax=Daphnia pulex TaxID=6669 RepID=E9GUD1_DAPPU|nr:hypothetical protein DAPPUDRAFT_322019 [Daphnia pulex]|eukprot:EFX76811.1 hypothetical protein DAPPUDRAFT_322019 [Daphnia pulex]